MPQASDLSFARPIISPRLPFIRPVISFSPALFVFDCQIVHAPNSVVSQILNLDQRGVEFGADHHTPSDKVEKEQRDHHPGTTISNERRIGKECVSQFKLRWPPVT